MGQYHVVVNLDKHEYLFPHRLGDGLKLMEFGNSAGGVMTALAILLAVSNGRGGGDLDAESPLIGSWGGDRIAIVGDYAEATDLAPEHEAETIFARCGEDDPYEGTHPRFIDISGAMRSLIESDGLYTFSGTGWLKRTARFGGK